MFQVDSKEVVKITIENFQLLWLLTNVLKNKNLITLVKFVYI